MSISTQERLARIRVNAFLYFRSDWLARLIEIFGSAEEILKQNADTLAKEAQMNPATAAHFLRDAFSVDPEEELEKTEKYGGRILVPEDEEYPQSLRDIKEAPVALYVLGKLPQNKLCIGMVGTRKITAYGRRAANTLATGLAESGAVIISGLARGIDSECHAAAVRLHKPTVAVIGTGLGRCYPPENRELALEMGKDVLAVPGPIDSPQSSGPNHLIQDGAGVVTCVKDIIDYIPAPDLFGLHMPDTPAAAEKARDGLSDVQQRVLNCVGSGEVSTDQVVEALGLSVPEAAAALFELEVKGILACNNGLYAKSKF